MITKGDKVLECHEEIVSTATASLHMRSGPSESITMNRGDSGNVKIPAMVMEGYCGKVPTGCGTCHVSRPVSVGKGLVNKHFFKCTPQSRQRREERRTTEKGPFMDGH